MLSQKKKVNLKLLLFVSLLLNIFSATAADSKVDKSNNSPKRLLYVSFDKDLNGQTLTGTAISKERGKVTLEAGKKGKAAFFNSRSCLEIDAAGLIDQNEGTACFWVKPESDAQDGQAHCLLELAVPPYNFLDSGLVITKGFSKKIGSNYFYCLNGPPWHSISLSATGVWARGKWQHLAFTWSQKKGIMQLYKDGVLISEIKKKFSKRPSSKNRVLVIGARKSGVTPNVPSSFPSNQGSKPRRFAKGPKHGAMAYIDEVEIYDGMLSGQAINKLAGNSGTAYKKANDKLSPDTFTKMEFKLKTACIPFARPIAGKILKVLFVVPIELARDVAELRQRMEIDSDVYLFSSYYRNPFFATKHAKRFFSNVKDEDMIKLMNQKLDSNPDVIVMAGAKWQFIPSKIKNRIKAMVKNGTGFAMFGSGVTNNFRVKDDAQVKKTLASNTPWSAFREMFINSNVARSKIPELALNAGMLQKGRVVGIKFNEQPFSPEGYQRTEPGLTPCLYKIGYTREWPERYNKYIALAGRIINWAGKNDSTCSFSISDGLAFQQKELDKANIDCKITCSKAGTLQVICRDIYGKKEFTKNYSVSGKSNINISLPFLKCGTHYLDVKLLVDDKTEDWGNIAFKVKSPEAISQIKINKDSLLLNETVFGTVSFDKSVSNPSTLIVEAIDSNNRVFKSIKLKLNPGNTQADFELKMDDPLTCSAYLKAILIRGEKVIAEASKDIFIAKNRPNKFNADKYPSLAWCGFNLLSGPGMIYAKQLRKAGFNILLTYPKDTKLKNAAMFDFMSATYMTSLRMLADNNGGTKGGCWASQEVKDREWLRIKSHLLDTKNYFPFIYSLGDENIYRGEMGFSKAGIRFYRDFLKQKYENIKTLNQEWKSNYANFKNVPRLKLSTSVKSNNVPSYIDHSEALEKVWRDMYIYLKAKLRDYDKNAVVGAEGSETHNLEKMVAAMDFWAPYSRMRQDVFMRRMKTIKGHWHGAYCEFDQKINAGLSNLWHQLFMGFSNTSFYFHGGVSSSGEGMLNPDGSYTDFFRLTQYRDLQLIINGVGQLLRYNYAQTSNIMMHWSHYSRIAGEVDDRFGNSAEADWRFIELFQKTGISSWSYLTKTQLEKDKIPANVNLFILPLTQCLSKKEIACIKSYVKNGGTILAVGPIGMRNEYGREYNNYPFSDILGIKINGKIKVSNHKLKARGKDLFFSARYPAAISNLKCTSGKILVSSKSYPLFTYNKYGKGKAFFLNGNIARFKMAGVNKMLLKLAKQIKLMPEIKFSPSPDKGIKWGILGYDDFKLLGVILDPRNWNGGIIKLKRKYHIYDVLKGHYIGYSKELKLNNDKAYQSANLFCLQKEKLKDFALKVPKSVKTDEVFTISCIFDTTSIPATGRVVKVVFKSPENKIKNCYQRMLYLKKDGRGTKTMEFALNDQTGIWTVTATDIATGVKQTVKMELVNYTGENK